MNSEERSRGGAWRELRDELQTEVDRAVLHDSASEGCICPCDLASCPAPSEETP